ncbi:beta strand repeat-containing protein [Rariglobus hedericola]|nr:autotransporter-associated beta strand repeat-containing protein [Rariglobus hedericola]
MNAPHNPQVRHAKYLATLAALSLAALSQQASATDVTWLGNTSNLWNVGSNWSTSAVPANGDTLIFGSFGSSGSSLSDNITSLTVGGSNTNGLVFGLRAGGSYTIGRSASEILTLASSGTGIGIKNTSLFLQTISAPLVLSGDQTIQVGEINGPALSSLTLSSGITGGARLTKTGTGLLTLNATSSYTGLTVNGGTLSISGDSQLGFPAPGVATPGLIVLNGGTLQSRGNIAISANRGISLGDANAGSGGTISTTNTTTYNGIIANNGGTNSLTKTGASSLTLGGANTYTGDTNINQGSLVLNFGSGVAPTSNIISSSSKLVLGGPSTAIHNSGNVNATLPTATLSVTGAASTTNTQTFNGLTLNQGNNAISVTSGTGGSATLALGAITANAGGAVNFTLPASGAITTSTGNTNGILGGWATVGGTAWATNSAGTGTGNVVAFTGYTTLSSGTVIASNAAANVAITTAASGSSTMAASGVTDINSLQLNGSNAYTVSIGSGNTLRLGAQGGILFTGTTAQTISGGILTAGGADNVDGQIVIHAANTPSISSSIQDNGTGKVSLVANGVGSGGGQVMSLSGSNTYSGGTYINSGKVNAANVNAFGTGDVNVLYSGGAILGASGTFNNNFNVGGIGPGLSNFTGVIGFSAAADLHGTLTLLGDTRIATNAAGTISGKITGNFGLEITQTTNSAAGGSVTLSNTGNDFTGGLAIHTGITSSTTTFNTGAIVVKLGASEVITNGAGKGNVTIFSGSTTGTGTLDLNGYNETINGLVSGTGTSLNGSGSTPQVFVTNNAAGSGTATLTLGDGNATALFAGIIKDGVTAKVGITKIGDGVQTLSGLNTYTGGTAVDSGTLASGANFTMNGSNRISIAGAGLAGVNYGTMISTTGTLTFAGTLGLNITASLTGGESFTLFSANGGALAGNFSSVSLTGSYLASLTDNGSGIWTGSANGLDFTFATSGINAGILSVSAVPEPSTYAAIFGVLALGAAATRRRRSN